MYYINRQEVEGLKINMAKIEFCLMKSFGEILKDELRAVFDDKV